MCKIIYCRIIHISRRSILAKRQSRCIHKRSVCLCNKAAQEQYLCYWFGLFDLTKKKEMKRYLYLTISDEDQPTCSFHPLVATEYDPLYP